MFFGRTQKKPNNTNDGFTLIEVLAGMIMATIFVLITSQAIAISAVFRVRAQREAEAVNWIQENLEDVKYVALLNLPGAQCKPTTTVNGYAQALINQINTSTSDASFSSPRALLNKSYTMRRTVSVSPNSTFFRLMTVSYAVVNPDGGAVIADLYTEVIPDAALQCK